MSQPVQYTEIVIISSRELIEHAVEIAEEAGRLVSYSGLIAARKLLGENTQLQDNRFRARIVLLNL
ncbi:hypothetical protein Rhe02_83650 [Rhizocola hellebori]|uniref:Uncharacterized protein n=1 Tax=Rhizocola hellebori TaxID=1392758 RepID=A0A8J3QIZ8_9ACTN|nr:hypothetical protein [Rhizocola hellebori]GIH10298.1 hypothetical protein Rhe02_83650 [Rhizocola hellebori]